jgi:hypothetical protein
MTKTTVSMMGATIMLAMAALTGSAAATKQSTVFSGCVARGTECHVSASGDGLNYCFDNSNGTQCVHCPGDLMQNNDCTMALTTRRGPKTIEGIMKAPVTRNLSR